MHPEYLISCTPQQIKKSAPISRRERKRGGGGGGEERLFVSVIFCRLDVACVAGVVREGRGRGSENKGGVTQAMSMVGCLADLFWFVTRQKSVCEGGYLYGGR